MSSNASHTFRRRCASTALAMLFAAAFAAPSAYALDESDSAKRYWQDRYRGLLTSADELRVVIARETELYADANRRNYRRGTKRHLHRVAAEEAREKLARVEQELATIKDEGRRAGALPGWFYEVEEEREDVARNPALAPDTTDPDAGRNPRFVHPDQDAPAAVD